LQVLVKDLMPTFRAKKWAQKAHARRERRRAARQKEVEYQPQFPADRPQEPATAEGNGSISAEAEIQPRTNDWIPAESRTVGQKPTIRNPEGDFEDQSASQKKQEHSDTPQELAKRVEIKRRDAKRMLRATKKIAYDLLRSTQEHAKKPKP
jgi:hypothetical protein